MDRVVEFSASTGENHAAAGGLDTMSKKKLEREYLGKKALYEGLSSLDSSLFCP